MLLCYINNTSSSSYWGDPILLAVLVDIRRKPVTDNFTADQLCSEPCQS